MIEFKMPFVVDINLLVANDYNPNRMPKNEMVLLADCVRTYGFLFPIITTKFEGKYMIIDGYHRFETLKSLGSDKALIVDLAIPLHQAVQLTVLMNRIKGMHQVESMSDLVVKLNDLGLEDAEIAKNLGMETEEIIRLKSVLGIAHAFSGHAYSNSWEV